jgi:putative transposase
MPNHVHLIAVPEAEDGLRRAIGETHRRYSRRINDRMGWRGHLWQGRFTSFVMDEPNLLAAVRHVELSPVRAGLARRAEAYSWSSASAHIAGRDDRLVHVSPLLERVGDWRSFLSSGLDDGEASRLRLHGSTGRPLGDDAFLGRLEAQIGRVLRRRKPGPKRRSSAP